ncbi:hypothetical protein VT50_0217065 [Streptomyces antioxidans]|uniref:Uncharacterized protein n=1 Tax=Streptomyces antioxidans TaxID=1507734 RepID=A0A1V4D4G0_9ACTN|nr:hypothetical protein [Streptomyces antioxidans]OPF79077.1 hypothetical protein VT50_0217065 [Streptomyces antioxidans]
MLTGFRNLGSRIAELVLPHTEAAAGCAPDCWCAKCGMGLPSCGADSEYCITRCCHKPDCTSKCA